MFKGDLEDEANPLNINWTYAELDGRASRLAQKLVDAYGLLTDTAVPICIEKSPALYVAILGILKAGGAWCPIDTFSPAQRRHDLIERTSSRMVLLSSTDGAQPENAIPVGVDVIDVENATSLDPGRLLIHNIWCGSRRFTEYDRLVDYQQRDGISCWSTSLL